MNDGKLLTTREAVAYLHELDLAHIGVRTLERLRHYGGGPDYRKVGGRALYATRDLDAWAAGRTGESRQDVARELSLDELKALVALAVESAFAEGKLNDAITGLELLAEMNGYLPRRPVACESCDLLDEQ